MSSSDVAVWIQTIVIVLGFGLAYRQFGRWREEIAHDKRIDLAMKIGEATYRLRESFRSARFASIHKRKDVDLSLDPLDIKAVEESRLKDLEYDGRVRGEKISASLGEIEFLAWQSSLLFDPDIASNIWKSTQDFMTLYSIFEIAVYKRNRRMISMDEASSGEGNGIFGRPDLRNPKDFGRKVDETAMQILETVKKVTLGQKSKYEPGGDWRTL